MKGQIEDLIEVMIEDLIEVMIEDLSVEIEEIEETEETEEIGKVHPTTDVDVDQVEEDQITTKRDCQKIKRKLKSS